MDVHTPLRKTEENSRNIWSVILIFYVWTVYKKFLVQWIKCETLLVLDEYMISM